MYTLIRVGCSLEEAARAPRALKNAGMWLKATNLERAREMVQSQNDQTL